MLSVLLAHSIIIHPAPADVNLMEEREEFTSYSKNEGHFKDKKLIRTGRLKLDQIK